ncbi:MAG: PAS domain-containing protein [Ferruginibacter sp.]|nr:PAS domain-containing protein [Cytophagales bacterium]
MTTQLTFISRTRQRKTVGQDDPCAVDLKVTPFQQHVVGIGASAGGIEAIYAFFDHTPPGQVSYVVVQHLSPNHQSRLAELMAKHSRLAICVAENNMRVEANKVYVIPHQAFMTIRAGKLRLTEKRGREGPHLTVNVFLTSLAADLKEKAIGVILSGTGTDGGQGVEAIKKAGGMVIVQDPATAAYAGMPDHALATGLADAVLSPQAMPAAIQAYVHASPGSLLVRVQPNKEEESDLVAILNLMKNQLPLDFSEYKRATIFRRIRKRMSHCGVSHSGEYLALLADNPAELEALAKNFLISVTSFFRDPKAFEMLEREVIPAIMNRSVPDHSPKRDAAPVKIWVAGCATGEEAYSVAMLVEEYLDKTLPADASPENGNPQRVKIFATDLDQAALTVAARGIYPGDIEREVTPERLARFFLREGEGYRVKPSLRKLVIFAGHNLGRNPPYCHVDLISCRNLLIYLNPALQERIFSMLHFGLRTGGYLFLGASEHAEVLKSHLRKISARWKIYQKTDDSRKVIKDHISLPLAGENLGIAVPAVQAAEPFTRRSNLAEAVAQALVREHGQAGVVVDEDLRVVQSFGELSPYVLPKVFNLNLPELLSEPLARTFGAAAQRAIRLGERVVVRGIDLPTATGGGFVTLLVKPLTEDKHQPLRLLVLFSQDQEEPAGERTAEWFDDGEHTRQYVQGLVEELREARDGLQSAREEMASSQENMLSFNEELLSANEEMQSGNEELQSLNEELQTVNAEYQLKIRELTELNDDLNNYFRSNVSGQLFVDQALRLKKFSPAAVQHVNLTEGDIGRPLHHLTTNIRFDTLVDDVQQVIDHGQPVTKEVQATNGRWYQVTVISYLRQADPRPTGAMVTFYDITDLVLGRRKIEESAAETRLILEAMPQITIAAFPDGRIEYFNQRWYDYSRMTPEESPYLGSLPALHPEDTQEVASRWQHSLATGGLFESEFRLRRGVDGAYRWHLTRALPIRNADGKITKWVSTTTDIHDQRTLLEAIELARQQLITTNEDLNRTNVDLDNFVYAASHDLRSPITTLQGLMNLLSQGLVGQLDEETGKILGMAETSIAKLLGVIDDLTDIAKVQRNAEVEKEPVAFQDLLDEVLADLGEPIAASQARLRLHIETQHLLYARKNLRSILYNLLSNAIKYRSHKRVPEVHLTFRTMAGKPVLTVADNGLGLKPEQLARLFSLYKRFHNHVEGTGIGLYMVKRIVDNNGGRIEVTSQEGQGTTFTVHFGPDQPS